MSHCRLRERLSILVTPQQESAHREHVALAVALTFPTFGAWLYFIELAGHPWAQHAYFATKTIQFSLPLLALWLLLPKPSFSEPPWHQGRPGRALLWGLLSGVAMLVLPLALYFGLLRGSDLAVEATIRIAPKLEDFGVTQLGPYLLLAVLLSVVHSLLEEFYHRWFIFGRLRLAYGVSVAMVLSALGFMAHHVIVIATYLGPDHWVLTTVLSLAVAASGAFWAWLYNRCGSLLAPWVSHILADLGIMAIGYDLVWGVI